MHDFSPGSSKMQDQCKMGIETGTQDVILYTE